MVRSFTQEEQKAVLDVVAAMLHLSNADFVLDSTVSHGDDAAKLADASCVQTASDLLGLEYHPFAGAMTGFKVRAWIRR